MLVVDGYVRIRPTDGPSASPIQRAHILRWAADRGWRISRVFYERVGGPAGPPLAAEPVGGPAEGRPPNGQAGGLFGSPPLLGALLDRVESGESDGLVIPRLAHLGDSLGEVLGAIERVQAAGGAFVSVVERFDLSTENGRQMLRVLLSIDDW